MDSYPNEFLAHHVPLMFVAGLDIVQPPTTTPGPTSKQSQPVTGVNGIAGLRKDGAGDGATRGEREERDEQVAPEGDGDGKGDKGESRQGGGVDTSKDDASTSIPPTSSDAPSTLPPPPAQDKSLPRTPSPQTPPPDQFAGLVTSLRRTLGHRKGYAVWDINRGTNGLGGGGPGISNDFMVVFVDKNIRFPPRKARLTPAQNGPQGVPQATYGPHSPISPLSPNSPLWPDGIMAPIWIKKHRELIPSVFILVLRLFSIHDPLPDSSHHPLTATEEGAAVERAKDSEIIREVVERKRETNDKGVKLALLLLTSRRGLDDPNLDHRIGVIRRQSGLDSRASLFVLSPVSPAEVQNFTNSLRAELFESAIDYYREHGRRVRRKRGRVPTHSAPYRQGVNGVSNVLSPQGWSVRYDYKMAVFAEFRGEPEVALKHYEDCYDALLETFASTDLLPPRTKRWAEAKVLTDCINVKICKYYMYLDESSRALAQHNRHVTRFLNLCNRWGIGEETFEFWSWLSKQYRLFADLLDIALRGGFRLPPPRIPPTSLVQASGLPSLPATGANPSTTLQHAGYYYYLAGLCAVHRRDRFQSALAAEMATAPNGDSTSTTSPAVAHEKKVNHPEQIIELFTKAYEYFKRFSTSRLPLFIASQIALVHFEAGNHDMALKFHERIAKTYRKEQWSLILDAVLRMSYESAKRTGDVPKGLPLLFELLAPESTLRAQQKLDMSREILPFLADNAPPSPEQATLTVDLPDAQQLLVCRSGFWRDSANLGDDVPFQIDLSVPALSASGLRECTFTSVKLQFTDGQEVEVRHAPSGGGDQKVESVSLGNVSAYAAEDAAEPKTADLRWGDGVSKVFTGLISSQSALDLKLESSGWTVQVSVYPTEAGKPLRWLLPADPSSPGEYKYLPASYSNPVMCRFHPRPPRASLELSCQRPAYLNEEFPITAQITNSDDSVLEMDLNILIQPTEDDSVTQLLVDNETIAGGIHTISLGVLAPGQTSSKTIYLKTSGLPGDRLLEFSLRVRAPEPDASSATPSTMSDSRSTPAPAEIPQTLFVPAVHPLHCTFDAVYRKKRRPLKPLMDMTEPDGWEGACEMMLGAKIRAFGPSSIVIENVTLSCDDPERMRLAQTSLPSPFDPKVLTRSSAYAVYYTCDVAALPPLPIPAGHLEIAWRRQSTSHDRPTSIARIPLPLLRPPIPSVTLSVSLPPVIPLHTAALLRFALSNPTPRLLTLSLAVESTENFGFSGMRKIDRVVVLPGGSWEMKLKIIPVGICGEVDIPRVRIWEVMEEESLEANGSEGGDETDRRDHPDSGRGGNTGGSGSSSGTPRGSLDGRPQSFRDPGPPPPPKLRELPVVDEDFEDHDVAQDGFDRVEVRGPLKVLVIPRG